MNTLTIMKLMHLVGIEILQHKQCRHDYMVCVKKQKDTNLIAVIGAVGSASLGISSEPRPSLIMDEAKSIIPAVSGRVALYSRSLTGD